MGSLVVIDDIKDAKRETILAELCGSDGTIDETRLQNNIDKVNGYIANVLTDVYTIPESDPDPILVDVAVRFVIYRLYGRSHTVPPAIKEDYKDAQETLEKIRTREIILADADKRESNDILVNQIHDEKSFDPDTLLT